MSTMMSRTGREGHGGPGCAAWTEPASDFGATLRRIRRPRGISQSTLAERAEFDHSYVSRLECGARMPTRDAVDRFATALGASALERRELLTAAGFAAGETDPLLAELGAILADPNLPGWKRQGMRGVLLVAVNLSRLETLEELRRA